MTWCRKRIESHSQAKNDCFKYAEFLFNGSKHTIAFYLDVFTLEQYSLSS